MGDKREITPAEYNVLHKVHNGGMKFKLKVPLPGVGPTVTLLGKPTPPLELYKIVIGRQTKVLNMTVDEEEVSTYQLNNFELQEWQEFWVTWYNNKLKMGFISDRKPFLVYNLQTRAEIGYVQFHTLSKSWIPVEWVLEVPPVISRPIVWKELENKLCWLPMQDGKLPPHAMIGGFEDEPIYIARAHHNNSLCPGKYVPSRNMAFIPWGHREHAKTEFEILCGFNAAWVETDGDRIPLNAFIGGRSEVNNEPLYIGRAVYKKKLLTGKVHVLYKTCYLPFNGKEIETNTYEILVIPQKEIPQAVHDDALKIYLN